MATTVNQILKSFGDDSVNLIRSNMKRAGQNATGETSASIVSEMVKDEHLQVSAPEYVYVLEDGRKPYQGGGESNLKGKIATWMRAKGVQPRLGQTIEQASKSIAYLINKNGSKLFRDGGRKDIITPIFATDRFEKLAKDIAEVEFKKVVNVLDNG